MLEFEPVIGLEVHAQLQTETKIFCGCSARFGAAPNTNTCPVCLGLPGALPVLNEKAVELAVRAALALDFTIPPESIFARKNYFYPDLPKGYQISQYDRPLAENGRLAIRVGGETRTVRIRRLHMEEDAGKLLHDGAENETGGSFVDLNRSGVPLIEIVTEPDIRSPEEAYSYLNELKAVLRCAGVSLANMEEGNLRCDANVSVRPRGSGILGTRVEIKNLNSFKNVQKALEHEIGRQSQALGSGETIVQETRLFDADRGTTAPMRGKEEAHDYRYFPDPDLLPLKVTAEYCARVRRAIPELPAARRERLQRDFGLSAMEAQVLTEERARAERFEEAVKLSGKPKQSANWVLKAPDTPLPPQHIARLVALVDTGAISSDQAKTVFAGMLESGAAPDEIVRKEGLSQITDTAEIDRLVDETLAANAEIVHRYRNGETKLLGVLVGQIQKASAGKANPAAVSRRIREKLDA